MWMLLNILCIVFISLVVFFSLSSFSWMLKTLFVAYGTSQFQCTHEKSKARSRCNNHLIAINEIKEEIIIQKRSYSAWNRESKRKKNKRQQAKRSEEFWCVFKVQRNLVMVFFSSSSLRCCCQEWFSSDSFIYSIQYLPIILNA